MKEFLEEVHPKLTLHAISTRTTALGTNFATQGATVKNIGSYHSLYKEFLDIAKAASKKLGRNKFGYMRSGELTT